MIFVAVYSTLDGRILRSIAAQEESLQSLLHDPNPFDDEVPLQTDRLADVDFDYVDTSVQPHQLRSRPSLPEPSKLVLAADGKDTATLNLPEQMVVNVDGLPLEQPTNLLELQSDMPDSYEITIDHWPYLPYRVTVVVE